MIWPQSFCSTIRLAGIYSNPELSYWFRSSSLRSGHLSTFGVTWLHLHDIFERFIPPSRITLGTATLYPEVLNWRRKPIYRKSGFSITGRKWCVIFYRVYEAPKKGPWIQHEIGQIWPENRAQFSSYNLTFSLQKYEIIVYPSWKTSAFHVTFQPRVHARTFNQGCTHKKVLNPGAFFGCLIPLVKKSRVTFRLLWRTQFFDKSVSAFSWEL